MLENSDEPVSFSHPPTVRFLPVAGRPREETVDLDWPFDFGGRLVDKIVVRRMNVAQVEAFVSAALSEPRTAVPMLFFPDGTPVPGDVLDNLDADDDSKVYEVVGRFLPRRLREEGAPALSSGVATSPSSQAA